jgi:glycerol-3-phosphate cytidylyltransferase
MKIGFTCSSFDLFHSGHYLMLEDAKKQCDFLIVGIQTDPTLDKNYRLKTNGKNKNKPIQTFEERLIQVSGCTSNLRKRVYNAELKKLDNLFF